VKTPKNGTSFFDTWLVPLSVGIVAVLGLAYLAIMRPQEQIADEDRASRTAD
jgi:hypothetical protein